MCKYYKDSREPMHVQKTYQELKFVGKKRGITRHDLGIYE